MNKLLILSLALVACLALASAASVDDETRAAARDAFRKSSNFFTEQIRQNMKDAKAQANINSKVGRKAAKFQSYIDEMNSNKDRMDEGEEEMLDLEPVQAAANQNQTVDLGGLSTEQ